MASIFGNTIIQNLNEEDPIDARIKEIINKSYNIELNAFYRAFVSNNKDPLKLGRVQVRVPSIHGSSNSATRTPTEALPWASPGIWNCAANDMGQYLVPEIGTVVFITFEQGDPSKPIYFGGISNQIGSTTKYIINPTEINKGESYEINSNDYPEDLRSIYDKLLFKSAKGNEVVASDLDGKEYMYLVDASGQSIEMENFGPYLKRRGTDLGYSGKPRMKLSTNRGSDMVLTNESEIMTTRQLQGQLDDIKILNKTDDLTNINGQLDKLLRDKFKDFGNYSYNTNDKVFNLDVKLNDILDLTATTDKVYNYPIKIFNEFEITPGLFLQISLVEKDKSVTKALVKYRNTNLNAVLLEGAFIIYFAKFNKISPYLVTTEIEDDIEIGSNSEGDFYVNIWGNDLYDYEETWGFNYRETFKFIVNTMELPTNNIFTLDFIGQSSVGYIKQIDWGDGESSTFEESQVSYTHDYKVPGSYHLTLYANDENFRIPELFYSRGIISIESPVPISTDINKVFLRNFGFYQSSGSYKSTLKHINKYVLRNYLFLEDSISLAKMFEGCSELKEIPYHLLDGFNSITSLNSTFANCTNLNSIPEDLFEGKDFSSVSELYYTFYNCSSLEILPDFMFINDSFINIVSINNLFTNTGLLKLPTKLLHSMPNLVEILDMCKGCLNLSYIPRDLFITNKKLVILSNVFKDCISLIEIPRNLFIYNLNLSTITGVFEGCTNIEEINSDIFSNLKNLITLSACFKNSGLKRINLKREGLISSIHRKDSLNIDNLFYGCSRLKIGYYDLYKQSFDILPSAISANYFMYRDTFTGSDASTLPPLWDLSYFGNNHTHAFGGSGNNSTSIVNYSAIPSGWK